MKLHIPVLCCITLSINAFNVLADDFDYLPPVNYYIGATGTGAILKSQLTSAMSAGHIQRRYGDFRYSAIIHDADPNIPGNILLAYNRASASGNWDSGSTWNREHVWPQSLQPGSASNSTKGNLGDPHALRPANPGINSSRGNKPFGLDGTTGSYGPVGAYYFPGDADKGDIARQLFYSDTRWTSLGLSLVEGLPGSNEMSDLSSLVAWHYLDTPDEFELRRNQAIYSSGLNPQYYTNNRNAFVDHPEFVWSIYVDQNNDSQIAIQGATILGDGSSSTTIDLGSVIVGAPNSGTQAVTINKTGSDGTYYEITTSGSATSTLTGRNNAFGVGGASSTTFDVGLNASTALAGQQHGMVTIDNLDITNGAGIGYGNNDANDLVTVTLDVLDHAEPSFSGVVDTKVLSYDFGSIFQGASSSVFNFDIFNLEDTASFTSRLDLDSIMVAGDDTSFNTDLTTFTNLDAGLSNNYTATLDSSLIGSYSAVYTLTFSDEDIQGATNLSSLTLLLTGEVVSASGDADFNQDMDVDGDDFLAWQRGFNGGTTKSQGDSDNNGIVNEVDLAIWEQQFGTNTSPSTIAVTVPEPSSSFLAFLAYICLSVIRKS